ncbi:MAG: hypothetical protein ABEH65_13335 [Halobacteriales archaeon]
MNYTEIPLRRQFLLACGTALLGALVGCSGEDSIEEIGSNIEEANGRLEDIDPKLEADGTAIENEEWDTCFSEAESIRDDLSAARGSTDEALSIAEEEGHEDHALVLQRMQEYIDILEEMTDELEQACEAGQAGDGQQLEQHSVVPIIPDC